MIKHKKFKPCRVVMLVENMSFPRDRRVRQEASALASFGFEVSVICPRGRKQDTAGYEIVDGVRVYRYREPWLGKSFRSYVLEYAWATLCTSCLVLWVWARHGFDVLHAANPPDLCFLIAAPFKLLRKKFVYDQHDLSPETFEAKFEKRGLAYRVLVLLERCSYWLADLIIVTNESFYQIAMERGGVCPEKLCVVRNGPDLNRFCSVAPRSELKKGAAYLAVYVGVMNKQDGVNRVIQAADHIINVCCRRDIRFALLGTGECLEELRHMALSFGVESYVDFLGWVGDSDVLDYLSTADVCLAPDPPIRMNQLSTTIKIMEYMSCGKPIVSLDLLESRRSAGPAAVYVREDDAAAFGNAVVALVDDKNIRKTLGDAGYERIRTELHWGRSRQFLFDGYKRMMGDLLCSGFTAPEIVESRAV